MNMNDIQKIIKEEISAGFDFLNSGNQLKEDNFFNILESNEFQKQFIIDSILNKRDTIKLFNSSASIVDDPERNERMNIEYITDVEYKYKSLSTPIKLNISFYGNDINYSIGGKSSPGDYNIPEHNINWYEHIDWLSIEVNLNSLDNREIRFNEFNKAPEKIKQLFIRSYVEPIIEQKTDIGDVREKKPQYQIF